MTLARVFRTFGAALLALLCSVQARADATLDPYKVTSPSGRWTLSVNPSHMDGSGKATYSITDQGTTVWSGEHPFTLWGAAVTDDGDVCGYGYRLGYDGRARRAGSGNDVLCVVLDKTGGVRAQDAHPRQFPAVMSNPPAAAEPLVIGLTLDAPHDRFVVRAVGSWDEREVRWWSYRISTGESLGEITPEQPPKRADGMGFHKEIAAELIPGTPLLLVHWYVYTKEARFALLDPNGKEVWSLDQGDEYAELGEDFSWFWNLVEEGIRQIEVRPGGFDVISYALGARVTYEVRPAADAPSGYVVRELKRAEEKPRPSAKATGVPLAEMKLEPLGTIELRAPAPSSPIDNFHDFNIDSEGRLGFLRWADEGKCKFILVEPTGEIVVEKLIDLPADPKARFPVTAPAGAGRWIIVRSFYDNAAPTAAWWLDTKTMRLTAVADFQGGPADAARAVPGGGFACEGHFGDAEAVVVFDAQARRVSAVRTTDVGMTQSTAVRTDGSIAVLVPVANTIDSFDSRGAPTGSVKLADILPRAPTYPSTIRADHHGGLILEDFNGSPPVYRLSADNKVSAEITPKYRDGAAFRPMGGVQCAPDGALWTCDGHALLRLDGNGVVDRVLGPEPTTEDFSSASAVVVGPSGLIFAADARGSAIHVFDAAGNRLRVCRPAPGDFASSRPADHLTVAADGSVWAFSRRMDIWSVQKYIGFAPDGSRMEPRPCDHDSISEEWHFQPNAPRRWVLGYKTIWLVNDEEENTRTITHRPSGAWLGKVGNGAVASDGSLVVVTGPDGMGMRGPAALNIYSPAGDPLKTIALPDKWTGMRVALARQWAMTTDDTELHLFNISTGMAGRFQIPCEGGGKHYWYAYGSPDGTEVWVRDSGSRVFQRFKLPT